MATDAGGDPETDLTGEERDVLERIRSAETLAELVTVTGADSEHAAYFEAKRDWYRIRGKRPLPVRTDGVPGDVVTLDGYEVHVHGITHADTPEEGEYLRDHVSTLVDRGANVYCEQGIRPMYFGDFPAVCELDDLRWAMDRCEELDGEPHVSRDAFEGLTENLDWLTGEFQDAVFSMVDSGGNLYGDRFRAALGDVASNFLTSHEDMATGDDFESFTKTRRAARDPSLLVELQRYYEKRLLPQPLEREWLRRHDRELELLTYARNERLADSVVYHNDDAEEVHLIVGAAHQPGVRYYLERFRDGKRRLDGFQPVG